MILMVPQAHYNRYRILVVEDELHLLELYQKELEDEGFKVITATDGEQAINLNKKALPDLVVLDIKINPAYGGGLEVLKEIKTFDNKIPVILNSAYTTFRADFSTWLADAYVIKSSDLSELKRRIKELLHLD
ncbi:MAG: response regulator [candidate division Zixibacteria bacterium]|nr:response regulator [candidate division Zixibacteria bacterium]